MKDIKKVLKSTDELTSEEFSIYMEHGSGLGRELIKNKTRKSLKKLLKILETNNSSDDITNITEKLIKSIKKETLIRGFATHYSSLFLLSNEIAPINTIDYVYFKSINKTHNEAILGRVNEIMKSVYTIEKVKSLKATRNTIIEIGESI